MDNITDTKQNDDITETKQDKKKSKIIDKTAPVAAKPIFDIKGGSITCLDDNYACLKMN